MSNRLAPPLFAWLFLFVSCSAYSQSDPGTSVAPHPQAVALQAATDAARKVIVAGPQDVPLQGQAVLHLPDGFGFVPAAEAGQYLRALGNVPGDTLAGMVVPIGREGDWLAVISYFASGYIKDDDAKEWDADELLTSLREGTTQDNEQRVQMGIPALEIVGWVQTPAYDANTHRLAWSISARNEGQPDGADMGINYNTYALGREGYFSLNLVTSQSAVAQDKAEAHTLLSALEFVEGKRYADFNADTDKVAEYGLATLVAGAAAKKVGLLAAAGLFLAKTWKLLLIGAVGVAVAGRKLYGKMKA